MTSSEDGGSTPDEGLWARVRPHLEPVLDFHDEHPVYFWLSLVVAGAAIFGVGALVRPDLVVDQFLWRHFWGPTVADANQTGEAVRNGVAVGEGYTLVSEITYGLILAGALMSIYHHLLKKRGIRADAAFIGALLPYIMFGPTARALEDASVFCEAGTATITGCDPGGFAWLFISPIIYLFAAAAVILHLTMGHRTRNRDRAGRLGVVGAWLGVQVLVYLVLYTAFGSQFTAMAHPITVAAFALLGLVVYAMATRRSDKHRSWALAAWGFPMVGIPIALIAHWNLTGTWVDPQREAIWEIAPTVAVGVTLVVAAVGLIGLWGRDRSIYLASFTSPLNLTLVGSHMVDAFATFGALCSDPQGSICSGASFLGFTATGYGEKHPISEFFLTQLDGWGYVIMKLLLVTAIVVLVDQAQRDGEDPDLIGLVKLAVLVLGLAPGLRNLVRVFMGV